MSTTVSASPAHFDLVDGLSLWEAESQSNNPPCSLIRLDGNERLLIPFTVAMTRATVHYVESRSVQGYFHCNGPDCTLCRAGLQKDVRDLWPVYDIVNKGIGVIAITPNMRPFSLRPQLLPVLRQVKDSQKVLLLSIRSDRHQFQVSVSDLPDDADDGAAVIEQFQSRVEKQEVDLCSVYPRYANKELEAISEIAVRLTAKGIKAG